MSPPYTHTFEFEIDDLEINGEIEFNTDGVMSYKTNEPIDGITLKKANRFHALLREFKNVFDCFGGIKKIKLEIKE